MHHTRVLFSQMIHFRAGIAVIWQSWCNHGTDDVIMGLLSWSEAALAQALIRYSVTIGYTSLAAKEKDPELFLIGTSLSENGLRWYWCGALQTPNLVKDWDGNHTRWIEKGGWEQGVWHLLLGHVPAQCHLHDHGPQRGLSGHLHDLPVDQQEEEPWSGWWILVTVSQFVNQIIFGGNKISALVWHIIYISFIAYIAGRALGRLVNSSKIILLYVFLSLIVLVDTLNKYVCHYFYQGKEGFLQCKDMQKLCHGFELQEQVLLKMDSMEQRIAALEGFLRSMWRRSSRGNGTQEAADKNTDALGFSNGSD